MGTGAESRRFLRLSTFGLAFFALVLANLLLPRLGLFLLSLPIYFHALLFMSLGLWCWAVNVHVLTLFGIDCNLLLGGTPSTASAASSIGGIGNSDLPKTSAATPSQTFLLQHAADYRNLYRISGSVSLLVAIGVLWYQILEPVTGKDGATFIPSLIYIILLGTLLWPGAFFYQTERSKFLT